MPRSVKVLALAVLSFIVFSCSDSENEIPDTTGPQITTVTPAENAKVSGTLTINVTTEDISDEITIQVFVDDQLIKEEVTKEITAQINTKLLTEGTHAVKVVTTDKSKNVTIKTFNIEVRNILFTLQIPGNYVPDGTTIYHVLSKNDGTIIATRKAENGTTWTFNTPDNFSPDSSFVFSEFFHLYNAPTPNNSIGYLIKTVNSYARIKAGEFKLPSIEARSPSGNHHLKIANVPPQQTARFQGENTGSVYGSFGDADLVETDLTMTKATSDLFCAFSNDSGNAPVYIYLNVIQAGSQTAVSYTDFLAMNKTSIAFNEAPGHYTISTKGYKNGSSQGIDVFGTDGTTSELQLPLYYPGTTFANYSFDIILGSYSNKVFATTPPSAFKYLNAELKSISYSDRKIKLITTGEFDMITAQTSSSSFDEATSQFKIDAYYISFPTGTTNSVTLPKVPQELSGLNFTATEQFKFNGAFMVDYTSLSGDADYQSKLVFSSDGKYRSERGNISKSSGSFGGRKSSVRQKFPEELQFLNLQLSSTDF